MSILLLAGHDGQTLSSSLAKAAGAAADIAAAGGGAFDILVAGEDCAALAAEAAKIDGAGKVLAASHECFAHMRAEPMAALLAGLADKYAYFIAAADSSGKNIMPRLAALLDAAAISDVSKIIAADTFEHPVYAGNAIETVKSGEAKKVLTIRTTAFAAAGQSGGAAIEPVAAAAVESAVKAAALSAFAGEELTQSERPELTAARIVISGGRGMQSGENFKLLEAVADKLGAAIGASRAAVDAGYVPNDYQVGQTGKTVAPELYIAVGISGAIQHLAGMKDSRVIAAINKDEDAPIFQIADYGLVADLFQALPELASALD